MVFIFAINFLDQVVRGEIGDQVVSCSRTIEKEIDDKKTTVLL